jgi:hypothetical protein
LGCVLDNFFDIKPDKENLQPTRTLIYENNAVDKKILDSICREFCMDPVFTEDPREAQQLLDNTTFHYAIINPELERIWPAQKTKVIIVDYVSIGLMARILNYSPISVVTKPFTVSGLSWGIAKALGIPFPQASQFATISSFSIELDHFTAAINNWLLNANNFLNLEDSIKYSCENFCPKACLRSEIKNEDLNNYFLLNPFSKRGALYCEHKASCQAWLFLDYFKNQNVPELMTSPADLLRRLSNNPKELALMPFAEDLYHNIADRSEKIRDVQTHYCTEICKKQKKDIDIQRKDFIFSSLKMVLSQNYFLHCSEHDCPLMSFFIYFKRSVL